MAAKLKIAAMNAAHLHRVSEIEASVSPHPWTLNQFHESLERQYCHVLLLDEQVSGYLVYSLIAGESELFNIAVAPEQQGMGYGSQLLAFYLARLAEKATRLFLEVRSDNLAAITLYRRAGFVETGRRKGYYRTEDGLMDAIMMRFSLDQQDSHG